MNTQQIQKNIDKSISQFTEALVELDSYHKNIKETIRKSEQPVDFTVKHFKTTMDNFLNEEQKQLNRLNKQKEKYYAQLKTADNWENCYNHRDVMDDTLEALNFTIEIQKAITKNMEELDELFDKREYVEKLDSLMSKIQDIQEESARF